MKILWVGNKIIIKQIRFLICSIVITIVDYIVFFSLVRWGGVVVSNAISYCIAILFSFYLHRTFVFTSQRRAGIALIYVVLFSLLGIGLSTVTIYFYNRILKHIVLAKLLMTVTMFLYNYHSKKIAFGDRLKQESVS